MPAMEIADSADGLERIRIPSWSRTRDGRSRIAFASGMRIGNSGVHVIDIDDVQGIGAGVMDPVVVGFDFDLEWIAGDDARLTAPSWSPDGTRLAAAAGTDADCKATSGSMDIFTFAADEDPQLVPLAADPAKEYNPVWSPDGALLSFQRVVEPSERVNGRPCTMAVWIAAADGSNARRLEGLGTDDSQPPFWSPDGTRIVGNTVDVIDGVEHYDLYVETIDGSSPIVTVDDVGFATWQPVAAPLDVPPLAAPSGLPMDASLAP
jgi:Tol biopolymer transport system component